MHFPVVVIGNDSEPAEVLAFRGCSATGGDFAVQGGRYQGFLDGYDPLANQANYEECGLCGGTGHRDDISAFASEWPEDRIARWREETGGCNGCGGTGRALLLSFEWEPHDEFVSGEALSSPPEMPFAVVLPNGMMVALEDVPDEDLRSAYGDAVAPYLEAPYRATIIDVHY